MLSKKSAGTPRYTDKYTMLYFGLVMATRTTGWKPPNIFQKIAKSDTGAGLDEKGGNVERSRNGISVQMDI